MNKQRIMCCIFIGLFVCVSMPIFAEWTKVGNNTEANFANESYSYADALYWAMLIASKHDSSSCEFNAEIGSNDKFKELPKDLFSNAIEALIKKQFGVARIITKEYEELYCLRLSDGNFAIISIEKTKKE